MVKVVRFQLLPVCNGIEFKQVNKILWDLQRETMQISNRTVQLCWEWSGLESEYKNKFNDYPDGEARQNLLGYKALNSYVYSKLSKEFTKLNTGNLSTTTTNVFNKFKNEKIKYLKGEISIPSYKSNIAIDVHGKNLNFNYNDKKWSVNLSLLSNSYKKELGLSSGQLLFNLIVKSGSQTSVLEKCYDNVYKICASKIIYSKGKWFLNLSYGFDHEIDKPDYSSNRVMGCYLGEFNAVYCTFNDCDKYLKIEGGEAEAFRKQIEARRKSLLQQSKVCGEGRKGHGYHTRVKPIETISNKISNFRNTINHRYSKAIVEFARQNNCGMINFEDLKGISEDSKFLKNWSYFDLQNKIVYKAKQDGVETRSVKLNITNDQREEENADGVISKLLCSMNLDK